MKRIGFAGASGTGKTWLATHIAEELELPLCPVGSRQVAEQMGFASPYDVDKAGKRAEFQRRLLHAKIQWEAQHPLFQFVSDRTPIDNLTYTALHDVMAIDDEMLRLTREHFATYTHVIVCWRSSFQQLGNDSARVLVPSYHAVYEACLQGLLNEMYGMKTRFLHLASGNDSQDGRLHQVREFVLHRDDARPWIPPRSPRFT